MAMVNNLLLHLAPNHYNVLIVFRLVAFYKAGRGNLEFICGGNLISKSHVVTAGSDSRQRIEF